MGCLGCSERALLIHDAIVAYRAGDVSGYWNKLRAIAKSIGMDFKTLASGVRMADPATGKLITPIPPPDTF